MTRPAIAAWLSLAIVLSWVLVALVGYAAIQLLEAVLGVFSEVVR